MSSSLFRAAAVGIACGLWMSAGAASAAENGRVSPQGSPDGPARGMYLLRITGCNDCHTPGYAESGGSTPGSAWLTGNPVGFSGPWGTTYAANLRLALARMSEAQWLQRARQPMRPPMPWFALRDMSDDDLRAILAAVRQLGPAGQAAPAFVPPDQHAQGLFIHFVPQPAAAR